VQAATRIRGDELKGCPQITQIERNTEKAERAHEIKPSNESH
jgi:hypothetical protein